MAQPSLTLPWGQKSVSARFILGLLISMHITGAIGLWHPQSQALFKVLTPFNLIFVAIVLLAFQQPKTGGVWAFAVLAATVGYFTEVLGVATGLIFGSYAYGPTLGFSLLNVPLTIGLNWLVLVFTANHITHRLPAPFWVKAAAGAGLMTLLDFAIEPVAIAYDFWSWENNHIPPQNYFAWFVVAFGLSLVFHKLPFAKKNPVANGIFLIQVGFFLLGVILLTLNI